MTPMTTTPAPRSRIVPSAQVAVAVLVTALVLGAAALTSTLVLGLVLAAAAVVLAWGWAGTLNLPTPRGTVGTIVVGGLALVGSVVLVGRSPQLTWVPAGLGLAMIAAFVHQLFRRDGRPRVVQPVSAVVLALAVLACAVLLVPLAATTEGVALVLGALAAAGASSVSDLLGRWPAMKHWLTAAAMLAGGGAAVVVALTLGAPWTTWLLVGVAAGALSHAMRQVLCDLPTMAHARPRLVAALVSVLVTGVVPYLVALAFLPSALPG